MAEVSEQDLALMRGSQRLLDEVWNDPTHGMALKRAIKAKRPDISIPEIDVPDVVLKPINDQMTAMRGLLDKQAEEMAAMRQVTADKDLETKFRSKLDAAKTRFGLTDEGVEKTIEIMRERQIADPEAAAALHMASLPKPKPSSMRDSAAYGGSSLADFPGMRGESGGNHDKLYRSYADDMAFFEAEIMAVANEYEHAGQA